jgi:hypothetical protein
VLVVVIAVGLSKSAPPTAAARAVDRMKVKLLAATVELLVARQDALAGGGADAEPELGVRGRLERVLQMGATVDRGDPVRAGRAAGEGGDPLERGRPRPRESVEREPGLHESWRARPAFADVLETHRCSGRG